MQDPQIKRIVAGETDDNTDYDFTISELDPSRPMGMYAVTKLWGEAVGRYHSEANGMSVICVRLGRVIGKTDETLQSDSRLLGGDSGGPLFNFDGEIIAIHSRISEKSDQNFHVPIECFHTNWEFYRTGEILTFNKLVGMGFLGVGCEKTDAGLNVLNVINGSAADRIGLIKNDLLLSVDGEKLDSVEELTILISKKQPDESILLEFQRDGNTLSEKVTLGARPTQENK